MATAEVVEQHSVHAPDQRHEQAEVVRRIEPDAPGVGVDGSEGNGPDAAEAGRPVLIEIQEGIEVELKPRRDLRLFEESLRRRLSGFDLVLGEIDQELFAPAPFEMPGERVTQFFTASSVPSLPTSLTMAAAIRTALRSGSKSGLVRSSRALVGE